METIYLYFLDPTVSLAAYKYILVITDSVTRYACAFPNRNGDAKTVAQKIIKLGCTFGFLKIILHNRRT